MTSHSKLSAPVLWIPCQCPRPVVLTDLLGGTFRKVNSSSVPPPRGFQLSAPAPWFSEISEEEALGIVIQIECPRPVVLTDI